MENGGGIEEFILNSLKERVKFLLFEYAIQ